MRALRHRFHQLLRRQRLTSGSSVRIGRRYIYILPTRYGWIFGLLLALMLLASLNYDNNPAYLLTFLLIGVGSNGIFFTWRNLHGLVLRARPPRPVFAGEQAQLMLSVEGEGRERPALEFSLARSGLLVDTGRGPRQILLEISTAHRGWLDPGTLVLATRYPLGLFRAWSIIEMGEPILVYPRPSEAADLPSSLLQDLEHSSRNQEGGDELYGLREFRTGDTLSHTDWKSLARGRGLMTKQFSDPKREHPCFIDWRMFEPWDTETRLSMMARLVIDAHEGQQLYGLSLPGRVISPARGVRHYHRCLEALALFGGPAR